MEVSTSVVERIVRLEEKIVHLSAQETVRMGQEKERDEKLDKLILELGKYKGFIGGVLFVVSCIVAFLKLGLPYISKLLGKS